MSKSRYRSLFLCLVFCGLSLAGKSNTSVAASQYTLLGPDDLTYKGAFRYPQGEAWAYSGQALAYYPGGDASGEGVVVKVYVEIPGQHAQNGHLL